MKLSYILIYSGIMIIVWLIATITKNKIFGFLSSIMIVLAVLYYAYLFIQLGSLFSKIGF